MDTIYLFYILLFFVAFLYASVGHGGASGYLALMAIFSMAPDVMKPTALLLNLFVSLTAFIQFYRGRYFRMNLFLPFALASVPFAFLGGMISIEISIYRQILGWLLLIPVIRFLFFSNIEVKEKDNPSIITAVAIGAAIGFLSGLTGIGGGIILSPVILLLRWANMKETAAVSALFIFVNSLSGLAGQLTKGVSFTNDMYLFVALAFAGGLAGAYMGSVKFKQVALKYVLAGVLLIASVKLLLTR
jgi:uncharacterized membrane protein YfcA